MAGARTPKAAGTISAQDYRKLIAQPVTKNKFNAKKTELDNVVFDSAGEANRYANLALLQRAGKIANLKRQVKIPLVVNGTHIAIESKLGRRRRLFYLADFTYTENGVAVIEDFKGCDTPLSRLKRALVEAVTGQTVRVSR